MLRKEAEMLFMTSTSQVPVRIEVEIASDTESHERGLSNTTSLGEHEGMLFLFEVEDYYPFWMKDTRMTLDLLFTDARGVIVTVYHDLQPDNDAVYRPTRPARAAVEVTAGFLNSHGIQPGDRIVWRRILAEESAR